MTGSRKDRVDLGVEPRLVFPMRSLLLGGELPPEPAANRNLWETCGDFNVTVLCQDYVGEYITPCIFQAYAPKSEFYCL